VEHFQRSPLEILHKSRVGGAQLGLVGDSVPILVTAWGVGVVVSVVELVLHFALLVGGLRGVLRIGWGAIGLIHADLLASRALRRGFPQSARRETARTQSPGPAPLRFVEHFQRSPLNFLRKSPARDL
jgi:hypothetical protein